MFLNVTVFFCFAVVVAVVAAPADVAAVAAAAAVVAVVDVAIAVVATPFELQSAADVVELGWTVSVAASLVI